MSWVVAKGGCYPLQVAGGFGRGGGELKNGKEKLKLNSEPVGRKRTRGSRAQPSRIIRNIEIGMPAMLHRSPNTSGNS